MLKRLLKIQEFSKKTPTLLKLSNIYNSYNPNFIIDQANFLKNELPIRLAHRTQELYELPNDIVNTPHIHSVYDLYVSSFERIKGFKKIKNKEDSKDFSFLLQDIKDKHKDIEINIGKALNIHTNSDDLFEYCEEKQKIDKILQNFYMSRIGIRFLISQFLSLSNENLVNKDNFKRGMIDNNCCPYQITKDSISDTQYLINHLNPDIEINYEINYPQKIRFLYIPSHLRYILFEILKNANKAIINSEFKNNIIKIDILNGNKNILIKIKDEGNGFSYLNTENVFSFLYTSVRKDIAELINKPIVLSGYAHGLGLSRIYARYFGGDIKIISNEGTGTEVFIFLKILEANEKIAKYNI